MLKKFVCASLAAMMMLSISACGGKKANDNKAAGGVKWPKNVEVVVPYGAGGDSDYNARLFAQKLSKKLGANFVVSNVTGNGGSTGSRQVKEGKKDGSVVLFNHTAFVVNEASKAANFGFKDFDFAAVVAANPGNVIVVNKSLGVKNLAELKKYTEANPDKLKIAVQTGATSYVVAAQLVKDGFKLKMIDAGGAAARLTALLGGHVDIIFSPYGGVKDYIKKGDMVPLAMDGENDLVVKEQNIDVKNILNQGFKAYVPFYYFFAFPKGTDAKMIEAFNAACKDIVDNDKDYQDKIFKTYYQKPFFKAGKDGLGVYAKYQDELKNVQFTKVTKK